MWCERVHAAGVCLGVLDRVFATSHMWFWVFPTHFIFSKGAPLLFFLLFAFVSEKIFLDSKWAPMGPTFIWCMSKSVCHCYFLLGSSLSHFLFFFPKFFFFSPVYLLLGCLLEEIITVCLLCCCLKFISTFGSFFSISWSLACWDFSCFAPFA